MHKITRPEMVIFFYEIGSNINQKGDRHVGCERMLCERVKTPQRKISTHDKHYTVMGLTGIYGLPLTCVVIFTSKKRNTLSETGLSLDAPTIGSPTDPDFCLNNSGPIKQFPG